MHATRTHNITGFGSTSYGSASYGSTTIASNTFQVKDKIKALSKGEEDNWRGKMYHQFQLHGTQFFYELDLKTYPLDYKDIMNCLCKFRREDKHLVKECTPLKEGDFEYKQSEIDDSKELWEEINTTFGILADESHFMIYIPGHDIMMYRVDKKCDFFAMNREEPYTEETECRILPNFLVKGHISESEKKSKADGRQYMPIIGFYIR